MDATIERDEKLVRATVEAKSAWIAGAQPGDRFPLLCSCDRPQFADESYDGCAVCGGTATLDEPMVYVESGTPYPFFTIEIVQTEAGLTYTGYVGYPDREVDQPFRTRGPLPSATEPTNGHVSRVASWPVRPSARWKNKKMPTKAHVPVLPRASGGSMTTRTPPNAVIDALCREVGHGCPFDGCGNPFLTWHHFDPPWHAGHKHDVRGMIALCHSHHDQADGGAFTQDQLRELKTRSRNKMRGGFAWMRQRLFVCIGAFLVEEPKTVLAWREHPVVWVSRDPDGYLRLSVQLPTYDDAPRFRMIDNVFMEVGAPEFLRAPPQGRSIHVRYPNRDELKIEFGNVKHADLLKEHADSAEGITPTDDDVTVATVEVVVGGRRLRIARDGLVLGRTSLRTGYARSPDIAVHLDPIATATPKFPDDERRISASGSVAIYLAAPL